MAIPDGYYGRIAPRSSLAWQKHIGVGAGVIDSDYRGNIGVVLFNHSQTELKVEKGTRIAQLIFTKIENNREIQSSPSSQILMLWESTNSGRQAQVAQRSVHRAPGGHMTSVPPCRTFSASSHTAPIRRKRHSRPKCQCTCDCPRHPGVGCRRTCIACGNLVGPGCCWRPDVNMCHKCDDAGRRPLPDPEPERESHQRSAYTISPSEGRRIPHWHTPDQSNVPQRLPEGTQCLIVDTGAWSNIIGADAAKDLALRAMDAGRPVHQNKLSCPLSVSGIGSENMKSYYEASLPVRLQEANDGPNEAVSYTHLRAHET